MYLEKIVETFTYFNMYIIYIIITLTNKKIFFMSNKAVFLLTYVYWLKSFSYQ